jgi:hypothetical protein
LGKVFKIWFRGFKGKDLPDKFIRRSLGYSRPYPSDPVSELNDAVRSIKKWQGFNLSLPFPKPAAIFCETIFQFPSSVLFFGT